MKSANQIESKKLYDEGFQLLHGMFSKTQSESILNALETAMRLDDEQFHIRQSRGTVFAARNLIDLCPDVKTIWKTPALIRNLRKVLGEKFGLVRVLFFDKPSHRSWSLPFHKDMTIAVKDNSIESTAFCKPTHKAGVDHVEASEQILQNMLTLRIHLDKVTDDNGPLQVIPGSHHSGKTIEPTNNPPIKIRCEVGDVLAMRPLISHGSAHSNPDKKMHRRILHLEFCGEPNLPDGYEWAYFIPCQN